MTLPRSFAWTLLVGVGFAVLSATATAQDTPFPTKNNTAFGAVGEARDLRGIPKEKAAELKPHFDAFAKYYADFVAHPLVYRVIQDPSIKLPAGVTLQSLSLDDRIRDLEQRILEPNPLVKAAGGNAPKVSTENADYIRELGASLDAALKPLIERHPEQIVRINAARIYSTACRSGAPAHWPTVTALLTNQNTPTEVRYYLLQAAGNLLSAYDVYDYRTRRHAISPSAKLTRSAADKEIGTLVKIVEDHVTNPRLLVPTLPENLEVIAKKWEALTKEQRDQVQGQLKEPFEVVKFVRRQAIRALGQVRFWTLPGPTGDLYPVHTLARVCMADPTLIVEPSAAECAEAVIGICNMAPMWNDKPIKGYNADAVTEAVATGLLTFASKRSADQAARSLPWRSYSIRLTDAFKSWKPLFDPLFDPLNPSRADPAAVPTPVTEVTRRAQEGVLDQIMKVDSTGKPEPTAQINLDPLREFLRAQQQSPKRTGVLIADVPRTALPGVVNKK